MVPDDLVAPPLEFGRFPPLSASGSKSASDCCARFACASKTAAMAAFLASAPWPSQGAGGRVILDCSLYCLSSRRRRDEGRRGAAGGEVVAWESGSRRLPKLLRRFVSGLRLRVPLSLGTTAGTGRNRYVPDSMPRAAPGVLC